jgi:spore coat polysaccharide biosynthesis predicted glycosyltransferase SpsG
MKSSPLQIYIRVDGNSKIGIGHVFRTLNLATPLSKKGHKITFLTKNSTVKKIIEQNFTCKLISSNISQQKKILSKIKCDIVIIDKKEESSLIIKQFKKISNYFFAIDYVGKNKNLIENGVNILYPKSGVKQKAYSGLEYAILNKNFKKTKLIRKKVNSILVLQGGADTYCLIPQIIDSLNYVNEDFKITVVAGPSFKCWKKLEKSKKCSKHFINILYNVQNMSTEMLKHDLAITAGGMTLLELSRTGIPSIVICGEKLEEETAILMEKKGFGINLGFSKIISMEKLVNKTQFLINNYQLRKKMNKTGPKLVDGKGSLRIVKIITKGVKI